SRSGWARAAATRLSPVPLPTSTTSSARRPKTSSGSSRAPAAGRVSRRPRGGSITEVGDRRSQAFCRPCVSRSPRRTKETTSRWVLCSAPEPEPAATSGAGEPGALSGGRRSGIICGSPDPADDVALDGDPDLGQLAGGGARQDLAGLGVEARAVAPAVELGVLLPQRAAVVGAVPAIGGDVLTGGAHDQHERLLAPQVHQAAGVLGERPERDLAALRAQRRRGAEALALGAAGREPAEPGGCGGEQECMTTGEAGAFHRSRIASRRGAERSARGACDGSDVRSVHLPGVPGEDPAGAPAAVPHRVQRLAPAGRGEPVEVERAVQVIDLGLQRACQHSALVLDADLLALEVDAGDPGAAVPCGREALAGHGEAALERLLVQDDAAEALQDGVEDHAAAQRALRVRAGVDEQAPARTDLRSGETGAVGGVVGLEHVRHQGAQIVGDLADPARALREGAVADDGDRADCHAGGSPVLGGPEGSSGVRGLLVRRWRVGGFAARGLRASTIHGPRGRRSAVPERAESATRRLSRSDSAASAARKSRVCEACGSSTMWSQASSPLAIWRARRNSASRAAPLITTMFASHSRIRIAIRPFSAVRISAKRVAETSSCPATSAAPNSTSTLTVEPRVISR